LYLLEIRKVCAGVKVCTVLEYLKNDLAHLIESRLQCIKRGVQEKCEVIGEIVLNLLETIQNRSVDLVTVFIRRRFYFL